jgi:hypothetical protein
MARSHASRYRQQLLSTMHDVESHGRRGVFVGVAQLCNNNIGAPKIFSEKENEIKLGEKRKKEKWDPSVPGSNSQVNYGHLFFLFHTHVNSLVNSKKMQSSLKLKSGTPF